MLSTFFADERYTQPLDFQPDFKNLHNNLKYDSETEVITFLEETNVKKNLHWILIEDNCVNTSNRKVHFLGIVALENTFVAYSRTSRKF